MSWKSTTIKPLLAMTVVLFFVALPPVSAATTEVTVTPKSSTEVEGRIFSEVTLGGVTVIMSSDAYGTDARPIALGEDADISPNGTEIAYLTTENDALILTKALRVAKTDGSAVLTIASGFPSMSSPSWTSDGNSIVVRLNDGIWKFDLFTDTKTRLVEDNLTTINVDPEVSPDGTNLAWMRITRAGSSTHQELMLRDLTTNFVRTLTLFETPLYGDQQPVRFSWGPRSDRISIDATEYGDQLARLPIHRELNLVGEILTQSLNVTHIGSVAFQFTDTVYSPAGTVLARTATSKGIERIALTTLDGTFIRWLSQEPHRSTIGWVNGQNSQIFPPILPNSRQKLPY